jgi:hypothetical protein
MKKAQRSADDACQYKSVSQRNQCKEKKYAQADVASPDIKLFSTPE